MFINAALIAASWLLIAGIDASRPVRAIVSPSGTSPEHTWLGFAHDVHVDPPESTEQTVRSVAGRWRMDVTTAMKDLRPGKARSLHWAHLSFYRGSFIDLMENGQALVKFGGGREDLPAGVWRAVEGQGVTWVIIASGMQTVVFVKRGDQIVDADGRLWCREERGPPISAIDLVGEWRVDAEKSKRSYVEEGLFMQSLLAPELRGDEAGLAESMIERFVGRFDDAVVRFTVGQEGQFLRWSFSLKNRAASVENLPCELWTDGVLVDSASARRWFCVVRGDVLRLRLFAEPELVFRRVKSPSSAP